MHAVQSPEKPVLVRKYRHVEALVTSEMIQGGRIAVLDVNPNGASEGECEICGASLRFNPPASWETIKRLACGECASQAFAKRVTADPVKGEHDDVDDVDVDEDVEPSEETVTEDAVVEEIDIDLPDIPTEIPSKVKPKAAKSAPVVEPTKVLSTPKPPQKSGKGPCPHCGGLPKGKGWAHVQINGTWCPNSTEAKYPHVLKEGSAKMNQRMMRKPRCLR